MNLPSLSPYFLAGTLCLGSVTHAGAPCNSSQVAHAVNKILRTAAPIGVTSESRFNRCYVGKIEATTNTLTLGCQGSNGNIGFLTTIPRPTKCSLDGLEGKTLEYTLKNLVMTPVKNQVP